MTAHGELDLSMIDRMDLPDDVKGRLKQAWVEADTIRGNFEPEHVTGWPSLLETIDRVRRRARRNAVLFGGMDPKMLEEGLSIRRILLNRLTGLFLRQQVHVYESASTEDQ